MNKEFVTYEQAVALKELGFDERCFGHYNPNGVFFWKILCSDEDNDHTLSVKDIMEHVADGYVEAPLYQQAFRWLHEQLGFKSSCMPLDVEHREAVLNNNIKSLKEKYGNTNNQKV